MIDPTYLRTIYDGLISGTLHKDSASGLPHGLVGIYEDVLPPINYVNERHEFLKFFLVWALLKKEMSAGFVASLLGWTEENVFGYLARYSKWFNAPVSGKYVLYHERLRSFILQKISHTQFTACNEDIIKLGQEALDSRIGDECEYYSLEHLSAHLLIQSMEAESADLLKALAYNKSHWNRQVEISKNFEWSKCMLNDMMLWASKYEEDQIIECALNKLDLYHQEQNDAPRIVELVAQNYVDTALQRIEAFGGDDKAGVRSITWSVQRKFILYMICLTELTILQSKEKSFRKLAIEKLLKHMDENLPLDHSVLNWRYFFSSELIFQIARECAELGLDYLIILKRTDTWHHGNVSFTPTGFEVLLQWARIIPWNQVKCEALLKLSSELANHGQIDGAMFRLKDAIDCCNKISDNWVKGRALLKISGELFNQGMTQEAIFFIKESLSCVREECCDEANLHISLQSSLLKDISVQLANQGIMDEAIFTLNESLDCARKISDGKDKSRALKDISHELFRHGKISETTIVINESILCASTISNVGVGKSSVLLDISIELANQFKVDESISILREALLHVQSMGNHFRKHSALKDIAIEFAKFGLYEESLLYAADLNWGILRISALLAISRELRNQGLYIKATSVVQNSISYARELSDHVNKSYGFIEISIEFCHQGSVAEALSILHESLAFARLITDENDRTKILEAISNELVNQGDMDLALSVLQESIELSRAVFSDLARSIVLKEIAIQFVSQGKTDEALKCVKGISYDTEQIYVRNNVSILANKGKNKALKEIVEILVAQGKIEDALSCAQVINDEKLTADAMLIISIEQARLFEEREELINSQSVFYDVELGKKNKELILKIFRCYQDDIESMKEFLQIFAIQKLFFEDSPTDKFERFNRSLDIQWAMDIKNSLNVN